jgi:hypothetical protein
MIPQRFATRKRVLPVALEHGTLVVAAEDTDDPDLLDEVRFVCNREVQLVLASGLSAAIRRYYSD